MSKRILLDNIKKHYKLPNNTEFARFLGVSSQVVSNWYSRDTFNIHVLTAKCIDINPQWLLTGSGNMLREQSESLDAKSVVLQMKHSVSQPDTLDISTLLSIIEDKDKKIEEQAKIIGRLEGKVEYLELEIKKRSELDVLNATTSSIANVG